MDRAVCVIVAGAFVAACASVIGAGDRSLDPQAAGEGGVPGTSGGPPPGGGDGSSPPPPPGSPLDGGGGIVSQDGGPGGDMGHIACGTDACDLKTSVCCVYTMKNPPPSFTWQCDTSCRVGGIYTDTAALSCASNANCPSGQYCCLNGGGGGGGGGGPVQATCSSQSCQDTLCDPNGPATQCRSNDQCVGTPPQGLPPSYRTCKCVTGC